MSFLLLLNSRKVFICSLNSSYPIKLIVWVQSRHLMTLCRRGKDFRIHDRFCSNSQKDWDVTTNPRRLAPEVTRTVLRMSTEFLVYVKNVRSCLSRYMPQIWGKMLPIDFCKGINTFELKWTILWYPAMNDDFIRNYSSFGQRQMIFTHPMVTLITNWTIEAARFVICNLWCTPNFYSGFKSKKRGSAHSILLSEILWLLRRISLFDATALNGLLSHKEKF